MKDLFLNKMLEMVSRDLWRWGESIHFVLMGISRENAEENKIIAKKMKKEYGFEVVFYEYERKNHSDLKGLIAEIYERYSRKKGKMSTEKREEEIKNKETIQTQLDNEEKKDFLESMLDVFRDNVLAAFFWKRLLKAGIELPMVFAPLLFELCIASPIQTGHETTYECGLFVEKAAKEFSEEQLKEIEESILDLPEGESKEEQREYLERKRDRLLACIPEPMLKTDEAKKIIESLKKNDKLPQNEPLVEITSSWRGKVTDKILLEEEGVKIEKKENKQLMEFFEPLDNFNSQWASDSQRKESIKKEMLKKAREAYKHVQAASGADKKVIDMLWTKLASMAEAISRSPIKQGSEESRFCREILLKSSEHELPVYNIDSDKDSEFIIWSPAPRIEAAKGLPQLAAQDVDDEVLSAIKKLAFDKVTAIRFVLAQRLWNLHRNNTGFFWELIQSFADKEKNNNVLGALSTTLYNIVNQDESKTVEVLKIITENFLSNQKDTGQFSEFIIRLVVQLAFKRRNSWSAETINTILENQEDYLFIFNSFSFEIFKYLDALEVRVSENTLDMVIESLGKMINSVVKAVQKYRSVPEIELEENQRIRMKSLYEVFDDIVLRLYFSTDIEENEHYKEKKLSDNELEIFYFKIKPLLESLIFFSEDKEKVLMGPHTAYHFTRLLNNVLKFDPKGALHMAAEVALSSKPFGYNLDSTAVKEVVKTVETILADHRNEVREDSVLEDLLNLLDVFAETGWPEAIQLTWRLDEIFR
jgi:hypothetical protein